MTQNNDSNKPSEPAEISVDLGSSSTDFKVETNTSTPEKPPSSSEDANPGISLDLSIESSGNFELESTKRPELDTQQNLTPSPSGNSPSVKPAGPRKGKTDPKLTLWELSQMKAGADPLGKGIAEALKQHAVGALFLAVAPSSSKGEIRFVSTAAVLAPTKRDLWAGLVWDPNIVPDMWNVFVKAGQIELAPPGSFTNLGSHRNVVRAAFGILQNEYLLLVRAGPPQSVRGIVALVTTKSIVTEVGGAISLISSPAPK